MSALRTRAAHLLLQMSTGHFRCASVASRTRQVSAKSDDNSQIHSFTQKDVLIV